jgi:hypothetical protein
VGRVPHVAAYLRHDAVRSRTQRGPDAALARASFGVFTLDTYIKLLDDDLGLPLGLPVLAVALRSMPRTTELVAAS